MTNSIAYLVSLSDVTPNRATVVSVKRFDSEGIALEMADGNYDVVTDAEMVPYVGERVWISGTGRSSGRRPITGRA